MSIPEPLPLHRKRAPATPRERIKTMLNAGVILSKIAIESGVKPAEIKAWLDEGAGLEADIRLRVWLEDLDQRAVDLDELPFVETASTREMEGVFEKCRDPSEPGIGVICGPPGSSKTSTALRCENARRGEGEGRIFYFAANHFIRTPVATLSRIAEAVGWKTGNSALASGAYRGYQLFRTISEQLGRGDLILCDEAQHCETSALDAIRALHDEAHCGVCYLGNEVLASRLRGAGRRAEFSQITSRIVARLHLNALDEAALDQILESWGVSGVAERRLLHQIAVGPGGLRILGHVVREARILAREMKRPVDAQVLQAAASFVGID
jgi:DNA transposition AAA+ family ATPase